MNLLFLILASISFSLHAVSVKGKIDSIDPGEGGAPHLLMLNTGMVLFVDPVNEELFRVIQNTAKSDNEKVFEIDEDMNVIAVSSSKTASAEPDFYRRGVDTSYSPTVLKEQKFAYDVFNRMRSDHREDGGQCYNKAHIWNYEEYKRTGLRSLKLFLFFTTKYIRQYRYPWWFHVAPAVLVRENDEVQRYVLDREYTLYPMLTKDWTDHFIETERRCKEVRKYTQYYKSSKNEDCYLIETSMYYWQPRDIRRRDTENIVKRRFYQAELKHALEEAFE